MKLIKITLLLAFVLSAGLAQAGQGRELFDGFFTGLKTLEADFSQQLLDEQGAVLQSSSGHVSIRRPGLFRWDYQQPFQQLLLADGKRLWTYDSDLAQATVKPVDDALTHTPAMLLSADRPVDEAFDVKESGLFEGLLWVTLTPRSRDTTFEKIHLGFGESLMERMDVLDGFGQITRFDFREIQRNATMDTERFQFDLPDGVDLIGTP